jgi:hypothetical protein
MGYLETSKVARCKWNCLVDRPVIEVFSNIERPVVMLTGSREQLILDRFGNFPKREELPDHPDNFWTTAENHLEPWGIADGFIARWQGVEHSNRAFLSE